MLRQYARTKQAVDQASREEEMPTGPMVDVVFEIEHELLKERQRRLEAGEAERIRRKVSSRRGKSS